MTGWLGHRLLKLLREKCHQLGLQRGNDTTTENGIWCYLHGGKFGHYLTAIRAARRPNTCGTSVTSRFAVIVNFEWIRVLNSGSCLICDDVIRGRKAKKRMIAHDTKTTETTFHERTTKIAELSNEMMVSQ
jgi:hypothetical protein